MSCLTDWLYVRLRMRWQQGYDPAISSNIHGHRLTIGTHGWVRFRSYKVTRDELETLAWMIADLLEEDTTPTDELALPIPVHYPLPAPVPRS